MFNFAREFEIKHYKPFVFVCDIVIINELN